MPTRSVTRPTSTMPTFFDDFFKPWNEWFDNGNLTRKTATLPAVNVTENEKSYNISVAAPGVQKKNLKIEVDGNMLTISAEAEEKKGEKEGKFTRQEYSYSSFSRSFTLPEDVNRDTIDARYENGELQLMLPRKEAAKKASPLKHIAIQ